MNIRGRVANVFTRRRTADKGSTWEELVAEAQKAERVGDAALLLRHQNSLIAMRPNHAISYAWRGATHATLGNFREAVADCKTCLQMDPSYWKAKAILAEVEAALNGEAGRR
jgi:tetratricopeptide (TPR) repeat protein